jgi:hypothetical protein
MLETCTPEKHRIPPPPARSAREEQRRRDAAARRKLEVMRDLERLRTQLRDVWDETASTSAFYTPSGNAEGTSNPRR